MLSETMWDLALMAIIGAFCGLVVGQFLPNREQILFCMLVGIIVMWLVLTAYYGVLAYKEWKQEQKKNKRMYRGGYTR